MRSTLSLNASPSHLLPLRLPSLPKTHARAHTPLPLSFSSLSLSLSRVCAPPRSRSRSLSLSLFLTLSHSHSLTVLLDSLDKAGASPYLCACYSGDLACEAALAAAGAATNVCDKFGNDAQAYRTRDLRREDSQNHSPLTTAAESVVGRPSCCRRLFCCLRLNRVQDNSLAQPLAAAAGSNS